MGRRPVVLGLAVLTLGATFLVVTLKPALAHFDDSALSLHVSDHTVDADQEVTFFGRLSNQHAGCERFEVVELWRRGTGLVASDRTDAEGEFSFRFDPKPNRGNFFARYRSEGRFGYENSHRCGYDSSEARRIEPQ